MKRLIPLALVFAVVATAWWLLARNETPSEESGLAATVPHSASSPSPADLAGPSVEAPSSLAPSP
jgi:hypothetical protein